MAENIVLKSLYFIKMDMHEEGASCPRWLLYTFS